MSGQKPTAASGRDYLLSRWDLVAATPGVVYAETEDGHCVAIGEFEDHLLAADAVCAHNAVLSMRPRV